MAKKPKPDINDYRSIPALAAYLQRVASEHGMEIDQRNFKRWILRRDEGRYKKDYVTITLSVDGSVTCPEGYAPTEKEAKAIKAAWAKLTLPQSVPATWAAAEDQRSALGCERSNWFIISRRCPRKRSDVSAAH
jgi:hypothetical protein